MIAISLSLFFETIPGMNLKYIEVGKTMYSTSDIAFLSSLQMILFLLHSFYNAVTRPSCFCLVRSKMKSVKVEKKSADILTTVNRRLEVDGPTKR